MVTAQHCTPMVTHPSFVRIALSSVYTIISQYILVGSVHVATLAAMVTICYYLKK